MVIFYRKNNNIITVKIITIIRRRIITIIIIITIIETIIIIMYENIKVDINLVFLIQVYKVIFKVLPASVILISLALIKLFHKTAAEYLRDLIPKSLVFT